MAADRVPVGVFGTGYLGRLHARVVSEIPEIEAIGFYEPDDAAAAELQKTLPNLKRFDSFDQLASLVRAAVVASTTTTHFEVASKLLEADCDLMIEKPITSTLEDGRELLRMAKERGRIIQVGHVERYNPAIAAIAGSIGSPRYVEAERLGVFVGRSLDVDVLLDLMIHDLNLVLSFVGKNIVKIDAVGVPVLTDKVDLANVRLETDTGAVAVLTASRVSAERVRKFRFFGDDVYFSVNTKDQEVKGFRLERHDGTKKLVPMDVAVEKKEPLRAELEAFIGCVNSRQQPLVSGEDGLEALELAYRVGEAIEESMRRVRR